LKSDKNIKNLNNEVEKMFKHFPPEAKSKAEVMHVFIGASKTFKRYRSL